MQSSTKTSLARKIDVLDRRIHSWLGGVRSVIAQQERLEPIARTAHKVVDRVLNPIRPSGTDLIHGVWLGHPLHPVFTDVPIGAASAGMLLDAVNAGGGNRRLEACADAAWMVATVAMVPTAVAGITDWSHVHGYPGRVGLIHGTLNLATILLNLGSLGMRLSGERSQGVALSCLSYLTTISAAWLGGQLMDEEMIGVDHAAFPKGPRSFVTVMPETDLLEGKLHKVKAGDANILLFRRGDRVACYRRETCAHQGGPLSLGKVLEEALPIEEAVVCPWHRSQYRLKDGTVIHGPSTYDQPCYEVLVRDGQIQVRRTPYSP